MNGKKIVGWLLRGRIAAEGCSSIGAGSMGGENYCGNLLWQSSLTLLPPEGRLDNEKHPEIPAGAEYKCPFCI